MPKSIQCGYMTPVASGSSKRRAVMWPHGRRRIRDSQAERRDSMAHSYPKKLHSSGIDTLQSQKQGDWCAKVHYSWSMLVLLRVCLPPPLKKKRLHLHTANTTTKLSCTK